MSASDTEKHSQFPIVRSCDQECLTPAEGIITGKVPDWLEGCLYRDGPGLFEVGPDKYNHWFDGLALMHRFEIQKGGKVTYRNRFLRSATYERNMKAQRIVVSEFGTAGHPDPCMTIFQRFKSLFTAGIVTDNDNINIMKIGDGLYAATETHLINRIDSDTLETKGQVSLNNLLAVNTSTAHPHYGTDGTFFNMGSAFSAKSAYCIVQFPNDGEESLKQGKVLCRIPISSSLYPSYYHSFGLTENYVVFVEQSLTIHVPRLLWYQFWRKSYADSLQWNEQQLVKFHIVRRSTGELLSTNLVAEPFLVFHHANAFESEGSQEVVVDLCAYSDDEIIRKVYLKTLDRSEEGEIFQGEALENQVLRFVLPLKEFTSEQVESKANLVTLAGSKATATPRSDGSILCRPETLSECLSMFEMPQVNYDNVNGKNYSYLYGVGTKKGTKQPGIVKLDVEKRISAVWSELGVTPSEPIFVGRPDATKEDDGVILCSLLTEKDKKNVSLLVLDAMTMKEMARADFVTPGVIPGDLHGIFLNSQKKEEIKKFQSEN